MLVTVTMLVTVCDAAAIDTLVGGLAIGRSGVVINVCILATAIIGVVILGDVESIVVVLGDVESVVVDVVVTALEFAVPVSYFVDILSNVMTGVLFDAFAGGPIGAVPGISFGFGVRVGVGVNMLTEMNAEAFVVVITVVEIVTEVSSKDFSCTAAFD